MNTAQHAIARSVSHNEIAWLDLSDLEGTVIDLTIECEDNVESGDIHEFWGTTDEGSEWRVHVRLDK